MKKITFHNHYIKKYAIPAVFILVFGSIAAAILIATKAQSPNASLEPERGTLSAPSLKVSGTAASNGAFIKFKTAPTATPITLTPTADALVEDGLGPQGCITGVNCTDSSNKNLNNIHQLRANVARMDCGPSGNGFGTGTTQCHGHHNRHSYLKFTVPSLRFTPRSAKLRLYVLPNGDCNTGPNAQQMHRVYPVSNNSWSETVITWNNQPLRKPYPTVIGGVDSKGVTLNTYFEIVIYPSAVSTAIHTGTLSFMIDNLWTCHQTFEPKEVGAHPPQLVIAP